MNSLTLANFVAQRRPIIAEKNGVYLLDQTRLPHTVEFLRITDGAAAAHAISSMQVRGAPLIGALAAFGLALFLQKNASDAALDEGFALLAGTRPTAINLLWALQRMRALLRPLPMTERANAAWQEAEAILQEDIAQNKAIGQHGLATLRQHAKPERPLQIMTHCNAGWLATGGEGTALAPIYAAQQAGVAIHVWVSETRPRNQGLLTEWELRQEGIPHTFIADNAAGLLLRTGKIDAVIVGADRVAANGDVANKIGTYLKALACADNAIPFYVAAPSSTLDFACPTGDDIPIEERTVDEVRIVIGQAGDAHLLPEEVSVSNYGFDVTPARLISGIMTERGLCPATAHGLSALFKESRLHC